jgi:hypothetical protein
MCRCLRWKRSRLLKKVGLGGEVEEDGMSV